MFNTAGYDVVFEISRFVLQQAVYTAPVDVGPNNVVLQTFTPPFELSRTETVDGTTVSLNFIIEMVTLKGQPGGPGMSLELDFDKSSIIGMGGVLSMLAGSVTVQGVMSATPPDSNGNSFLAVNFSNPTVTVAFDQPSQQQIANKLGSSGLGLLTSGLQQALATDFKSRGASASNFGLRILASGDSTSPNTLTAVPDISWIDDNTLGVFGYYRQGASGGNAASKTDSDLDKKDFLSVAALIGADGFHRTIAGPTVAGMARDRVYGSTWEMFVKQEKDKDHNKGDPTPKEKALASKETDAFISSPQGLAAIAQNTPQPWGNGHFSDNVPMPDPFSDTTASTYFVDLSLGESAIIVSTKSTASVFCGTAEVDQHLTMQLSIDQWGRVIPKTSPDPNPTVDLSSDPVCSVAMTTLSTFFQGPLMGVLTAYIAIKVAEAVAEGFISDQVKQQSSQAGGVNPPGVPGVTWTEILISPQSMIIRGEAAWQGSAQGAYFLPGATIVAQQLPTVPSASPKPTSGVYHFPGTKYTCPPQDFVYTEKWFDTGWALSITVKDLALPVTIGPWFVTLGSASASDPRPLFTGSPVQLRAGQFVLSGNTTYQAPPPNGHGAVQSQIVLQIAGDDQTGWTLKARGQDGRYFLLVETVVTDASNTAYPVQQAIFFFGEEVDFGQDYYDAMKACQFKGMLQLEHIAPLMNAGPVNPVQWGVSLADLTASIVNEAVRSGAGGVQAAISQLIGIHGQEFTDKVFQAFITGATRTAGAMTVRTRGAAGGLVGGRLQNLA